MPAGRWRWVRHLAWGAVAAGLAFGVFFAVWTFGIQAVKSGLKTFPVTPKATLPREVEPLVGWPVVLAPAAVAGVVAAARPRWWVGPLACVLLGGAAAGLALGTTLFKKEAPVVLPPAYLAAGLVGTAVAGVRKRYGV